MVDFVPISSYSTRRFLRNTYNYYEFVVVNFNFKEFKFGKLYIKKKKTVLLLRNTFEFNNSKLSVQNITYHSNVHVT